MSKMTVKQYARSKSVSESSVYARIKRNTIESIKEDGKTYVFNDENPIENASMVESNDTQPQSTQHSTLISTKEIERLRKHSTMLRMVKKRNKEMKIEMKELKQRIEKLEAKLDSKDDYIGKIMTSIIPMIAPKDDAIDVDVMDVKKKKKKKGKKR